MTTVFVIVVGLLVLVVDALGLLLDDFGERGRDDRTAPDRVCERLHLDVEMMIAASVVFLVRPEASPAS